jgi:hypothetical protein
MPVLAHRLGPVGFASFAVLTGVSQYATLGVELGFNYVALAEMKRSKNPEDQRRVFSEVFYLKLLLAVVVGTIATLFARFSDLSKVAGTGTFALLIAGPLLTCVAFPAWFFILKDRLDINFKTALASKIILLVLCWKLVVGADDYILAVALFNFATIPFAFLYGGMWLRDLLMPQRLSVSGIRIRMIGGLHLSGAMLRETITNIGIAPFYGLWKIDTALGTYALAEKISKVLIMPAPLVSAAMISASPDNANAIDIPKRLLTMSWWSIGALALALCTLGAFGFTELVTHVFPQYARSIPFVFILVIAAPFVYFNYIEIGMRYTKHGRFKVAGQLSYLYVGLLLLLAFLLSLFFGVWGIAVACPLAEMVFTCLLLRRR